MGHYVIRRFLQSLLVLWAVTVIVFLLVHLSGDPVALMLQGTGASEADLADLRKELGYDKPIHVQYWEFVRDIARGDMGQSLSFHQPALPLVFRRVPATIKLAFWAMLIAVGVGVPAGLISAVKSGTLIDHVVTMIALSGQAVPGFWLGIMGIMVFAVRFGWLPAGGSGSPRHIILPAMTLATWPMARFARVARSSMLDVIRENYIRTARGKGLGEMRVMLRHALKNACLPVLTIGGLMLGEMLGGSVVTETVFGWPGIGLLTVQAVHGRDVRVVQACVLVTSLGFVLSNVAVDILYAYLDPRIVYE